MLILPIRRYGGITEAEMQEALVKKCAQKRYQPSNPYGKWLSPKILTEVRFPDIHRRSDIVVYVTPRKIINIECKLDNYTQVYMQARDHLVWADYSYVAMPGTAPIPNYFLQDLMTLGIGLILWHGEDLFSEVVQGEHNTYKSKIKSKPLREIANKIIQQELKKQNYKESQKEFWDDF